MSNRLFQTVIQQMKDAVGRVIGVVDENGMIIACSDTKRMGELIGGIRDDLSYSQETVTQDGYTFRFLNAAKSDCVLFVEGEDKEAERLSTILSVSLGSMKNLYDEKYDRGSFIKNIMMDNILPSDIYIKSKELHFSNEAYRVVMLIKFYTKTDLLPYEIVQGLFPDKRQDYVISIGEQDIVVVKEVPQGYDVAEMEELANTLSQTLNTEFFSKVSIGISTVVCGLKDLARAYKEARMALADHFAVLHIGSDVLKTNSVRLYANSSTSISLEGTIRSQIEQILESEKLKHYNIDDLDKILAEVETNISLQTLRNDKEESEQSSSSSIVATVLGYILGFVLYMFLLIYGAMVMQSVIEEKNNRVLEVMVSSVSPFQLMMGKILGVASVAVLQVVIWGVLICGGGALIVPQLMPSDVMAGVEMMQQGSPEAAAALAELDPDMLQAVAAMTDAGYIFKIFVCLLLFVFGGYLLYSAMFAAIGSAVDNVQDAQQLQTPVTLPIILALLLMMAVINDPNSPVAFWASMIPLTSPIVMMARIPYDIPMWEIGLSLVILYTSFIVMVWLAAKIYRVGIFMYGKKPTLKELWKWVRYKY